MRVFDIDQFDLCEDVRIRIILKDDTVYDCIASCWEEFARSIDSVTGYPDIYKMFLFLDLDGNYLIHQGFRVSEHDVKMWEHYGRN